MARADFIEGSCSPEVLDQIKARRGQGIVLSPETEKGKPLKIDGQPDATQSILPLLRQSDGPSVGGGVPKP